MRSVLKTAAGVLLGCLALSAQTPATVAAELRGIEQDLNPYTLLEHHRQLPAGWKVVTQDGVFYISASPLRALLEAKSKSRNLNSAVDSSKQWLDVHASQLESLADPSSNLSNAQRALTAILSRNEFAPPAPRSAWQRIREQINRWLTHLMERLFGQIGRYPITGNIVFWVALLAAIGLLAYWLVTLFKPDSDALKLSVGHHAATLRSSGQWLAALNAAKDRGDLRTAVQCAYWAAIARLQDTGDLPPATAKTPREYLRLSKPAVIDPLRSLTSSLERFWYGCAEATTGDLSACMQSLRELGCRWD